MTTRELRPDWATYLRLGIEFLIASGILKMVLAPNLNELTVPGSHSTDNSVHFLNKKIKELQVQKRDTDGPEKN